MKKELTIIEAAKVALKAGNEYQSVQEIYQYVIDNSLYTFQAQNPKQVLRGELRSHAVGIDVPSAENKKKHFVYDETSGKFSILQETDNKVDCKTDCKTDEKTNNKVDKKVDKSLSQILNLHDSYLKEFKANILSQLKKMNPYVFEEFCMHLISAYGFSDVEVTKKSRDGGIDGNGKLKVGIAFMSVAFQCKRFENTRISRNVIDEFRGAIQGEYEQGIFFTTSTYTKDALNASIKQGAVPIILIDGGMIVDFMIEKRFGIEQENLPIYVNAIDNIFS